MQHVYRLVYVRWAFLMTRPTRRDPRRDILPASGYSVQRALASEEQDATGILNQSTTSSLDIALDLHT